MALTKQSTFDYEVRGQFKVIQVRERVSILEDGKEISYKYIRKTLEPTADVSNESDEIKKISNSLWTDKIKKAYKDSIKKD
tara:strand:+ start:1632 stop:1874 length:243 start_codon:yes stop_codon:yes gene_type:complete